MQTLIPIKNLEQSGEFKVKISTQMETKPVLYGAAPSNNVQNYALTTFSYEDSEGIYSEQYQKNESEIKILKREKETMKPLGGVEFQLLNSEQKVIYQSLITNKNGEIIRQYEYKDFFVYRVFKYDFNEFWFCK